MKLNTHPYRRYWQASKNLPQTQTTWHSRYYLVTIKDQKLATDPRNTNNKPRNNNKARRDFSFYQQQSCWLIPIQAERKKFVVVCWLHPRCSSNFISYQRKREARKDWLPANTWLVCYRVKHKWNTSLMLYKSKNCNNTQTFSWTSTSCLNCLCLLVSLVGR